MFDLPEDVLDQIRRALAAGQKIEAIRILREATGLGLAEAKAIVEAIPLRGDGRPSVPSSDSEPGNLPAEVVEKIREFLFAGRKIEAIKTYREATGLGLKESKDLIDALELRLRTAEPERFTAPPSKGCGLVVLTIAIAVAVLSCWLSG
jgi:ribosomal protein L7/L12